MEPKTDTKKRNVLKCENILYTGANARRRWVWHVPTQNICFPLIVHIKFKIYVDTFHLSIFYIACLILNEWLDPSLPLNIKRETLSFNAFTLYWTRGSLTLISI